MGHGGGGEGGEGGANNGTECLVSGAEAAGVGINTVSVGIVATRPVRSPSPAPLSMCQIRFIIVLLSICNFFIANGVSLQGPFFPKEAEQKGATPLIYSSIFAIYELVMLVTSFIFGNLVERFKPNQMSGFGLVVTGLSTAIFGLLTYLRHQWQFVSAAFGLRILESLGATAFATSSYSFISACFPDRTATMFATLEMFFGLGVITGPVIGGLLYDWHGFLLPFLVMGVAITIFGIILISHPVEILFQRGKQSGMLRVQQQHSTPRTTNETSQQPEEQENNQLILPINDSLTDESISTSALNPVTLRRFLSSVVILTDSFIIITAITLMGFLGATLEPFIRHGRISHQTIDTGLMFVALGASYSFSALAWGRICDRFPRHLFLFTIFGSMITATGLVMLAPVPFLIETLRPNLWTIAGCMILFGMGTSSKQVTAYTHAMNYTIQKRRFPENQKTYGLISGMFFACLSFGGFIGPIIGGSLLQWSDFHYAILAMLILELIVLMILIFLQFFCRDFHLENRRPAIESTFESSPAAMAVAVEAE